jgi:hypothetical protein
MFRDGYRTLASQQGLTASGTFIEPQRRRLGLSIINYYISYNVLCYICNGYFIIMRFLLLILILIYPLEWSIISALLICFPNIMYAMVTFRNLMYYNLFDEIINSCCITTIFQCYEAIIGSMETTAVLDFKYVNGVYKSLPQTFLKTYIMFAVAMNNHDLNLWVGLSNMLSVISITVILIMLYDRKQARRISMIFVCDQPVCTVFMAMFLTACGIVKILYMYKNLLILILIIQLGLCISTCLNIYTCC